MSVLLSFLFVGGTLCHGWSNKCERITIPMCQDIGYNLTGMPNLMGQEDQMQADRATGKQSPASLPIRSPALSEFFYEVVVLEQGHLSLVRTNQELLQSNISGSSLEN
uniref:FZ domain-containing protein n=1 Tax=Timema poppense TaxID=170557 RepID=A0A7R9H4L0_TIMPO|nr:unnamed protein product [Timema poppensis]